MLPLRELQFRFAAGVLGDYTDAVAPWILSNGIDSEGRLAVYRNNINAGFAKTLALEFPVVERLVGPAYFSRLAREFQCDHPSRAGNLHYIGGPFPRYLERRFAASQYACLGDVAALEWAYQESLVAADGPVFDVAVLRNVAPEDYSSLVFAVQPACRLVRTAYPVIRIWRANQPDNLSPETIALDSSADLVLVHRTVEFVEFVALPAAQFEFVEALSRGMPLGAAVDAALARDAAFDAGAALRRFVALGVFTGTSMNRAHSAGEPTHLQGELT